MIRLRCGLEVLLCPAAVNDFLLGQSQCRPTQQLSCKRASPLMPSTVGRDFMTPSHMHTAVLLTFLSHAALAAAAALPKRPSLLPHRPPHPLHPVTARGEQLPMHPCTSGANILHGHCLQCMQQCQRSPPPLWPCQSEGCATHVITR